MAHQEAGGTGSDAVNLYQVLPPPSGFGQLSPVEDRDAVYQLLQPPNTPWVRALMVTNSQGDTVGPDGSSRSLTKGADRALVGIYRDVADAVVVGATTLRRERVPTPQQSVLVVLTQTGDMSGHQLVYRDGGEVIVVTRAVARDPLSDTFNDVPHTPLYLEPSELTSPTAILDHVSRVRPAGSVLVEGGRRTWELFAPITDEVCVTVRPPLTHDDAGIPSWWPGERSSWDLQTLWTDDEKMLYYRYLTGASARPQLS